MNSIKQAMAGLGLFGFLGLLVGCAEVIVPGAFTGASEAYHYTTSNIVKKTLMGDAGQVKAATRSALKKMDVHFDSIKTEKNETEIEASTTELDITITIEPVTTAATKVKVDAVEDRVFKDKATAAQILSQIEAELNRKPAPKNKYPKVFPLAISRLSVGSNLIIFSAALKIVSSSCLSKSRTEIMSL